MQTPDKPIEVEAEIVSEAKVKDAPEIVVPGSIGEAIANEKRLIVNRNKQIEGLKATIRSKQQDIRRSQQVIKQLEKALQLKSK